MEGPSESGNKPPAHQIPLRWYVREKRVATEFSEIFQFDRSRFLAFYFNFRIQNTKKTLQFQWKHNTRVAIVAQAKSPKNSSNFFNESRAGGKRRLLVMNFRGVG